MMDEPEVSAEEIARLFDGAAMVEFLPLGNCPDSWSYRVISNGDWFFLKLKRNLYEASLVVPKLLGFPEVVASISLSRVGSYYAIVYPYVHGVTLMESGVSEDVVERLGALVRRWHDAAVPEDGLRGLRQEDFVSPYVQAIRDLDGQLAEGASQFAALWQRERSFIFSMLDRLEGIAAELRRRARRLVLCHSDIHLANVLMDDEGQLHVVDWDGVQMAPVERDLMFYLGGEHEGAFLRGYGAVDVDALILEYYRCEWDVGEIADYGVMVVSGRRNALARFIEFLNSLER